MLSRHFFGAFGLALLLSAGPAPAAERPAPAGGVLSLLPQPSSTEHSITTPAGKLDYKAETGTLSLLGGDGAVTAEIFYTAYTRKPEGDARRPITFVFNGGPGAASAYLHIGALGPRVVKTAPDGSFLAPPQTLEDNSDTWLDMTDLVFVDPVGTGYSREAPGNDTKNFWGVDQDASSMGAFIRLFLSQSGRTGSPFYLAGESYGGFRAALLARTLQEDVGLSPSGIVLISPALEFALLRGDDFLLWQYAFELPAMAATRLEGEGIRGDELKRRLDDVERYAKTEYVTALASGLEAGRDRASQRVAEITGLPLALVRQNYARIPASLFAREFQRKTGKVLSLYDGTIATPDIAPDSLRSQTPDPVLDRSVPALTSLFVNYVQTELNWRTPVSYRLLNGEIAGKWDYGTSGTRQGFAGVMADIQKARSLNPDLGVLIAHGIADLVTPYPASRFLIDQLPSLEGAKPIRLATYEGGHMMYFRTDSRAALKRDAAALFGAQD
ncbi:MAG: peptidase S10 [Methylobacterium mesophilicum]|nr:peptidase S10 [Methylobacterium mesophilicum]